MRDEKRRKITPAARLCIGLIRVYQMTLSPLIGMHCRFYPTCSRYAVEAIQVHGAIKGTWMAARRLGRCHPLGGAGYDPVPDKDLTNDTGASS